MVDSVDIHEDLKNIVKEGWLEKESKFLRSWRKQKEFFVGSMERQIIDHFNPFYNATIIKNRRWFVLTDKTLYSFKEYKVYKNPTEVISLKHVTTIKSTDDETNKQHSFKLEVGTRKFYMVAQANNEKELWIGAIGKQMVKLTQRKPSFEDDDD